MVVSSFSFSHKVFNRIRLREICSLIMNLNCSIQRYFTDTHKKKEKKNKFEILEVFKIGLKISVKLSSE